MVYRRKASRGAVPMDPAILGFVFLLGVSTFFSPCSVALLPAYVAYYAGLGAPDATGPMRNPAVAGLRFGLAAAAGVLSLFVLAAVAFWLIFERAGVSRELIFPSLKLASVVVGLLVVGLGVLMLLDRGPGFTPKVRAPRQRTTGAMAGFGVLYAVASVGCTLGLFLAALGLVLTQPPIEGALSLLVFGAGLAGPMVVASALLGWGQARVGARIRSWSRYARPVSGVLLVASGLYVLYYYLLGPGTG
jgi:cytochrome c biogenesis protein CcdA